MKKILFAALAVFALASCAKDLTTEVKQDAIDFNPVAKGSVRSTVIDNTNFKTFFVKGYHNDAIYMDATVTRTDVNSDWTYQNKKYWPAEGTVDFYALYMENLGNSEGEYQSISKSTAAGYTLDIAMSPTDGSLCSAYIPDPVYAVALDKSKASGLTTDSKVLMQFRHAMAEVDFKIQNSTTADLKITIEAGDVYIEDLKYQGVYTTPTKSTTDATCAGGSWAFKESVIPYLFTANGSTVASGATTDIISDRSLVFPQTKTSAKILVNCVIKQDGVVIFNGTKTATTNIAWEEGYNYVYTLQFTDATVEGLSDTIEFTTEVKDMTTKQVDPIRSTDN